MLPLPLTHTERKLLSFSAWPAVVAAAVAAAYVLAAFLAVADRSDPWGTLALALFGSSPTWLVLGVAVWTNRKVAAGWVDTSIVVPATLGLVAAAVLVVCTTDYGSLGGLRTGANLGHLDARCLTSVLPCVSAACAVAALALTVRRRWLRRDPTRWTPRWER